MSDTPAFDVSTLRAIFKTEEARMRFDEGLAASERRVAAYLNRIGCDCDRCRSNEDFRLRGGAYQPRDYHEPRVEEYTFGQ